MSEHHRGLNPFNLDRDQGPPQWVAHLNQSAGATLRLSQDTRTCTRFSEKCIKWYPQGIAQGFTHIHFDSPPTSHWKREKFLMYVYLKDRSKVRCTNLKHQNNKRNSTKSQQQASRRRVLDCHSMAHDGWMGRKLRRPRALFVQV